MGLMNRRPSFEWDRLRFHGVEERSNRPYIAGQPRDFVVEVENLERTSRSGKLVFGWRHRADQWPRVLAVTLDAREKKRLILADFVPPTEGVYDFRLIVGGAVVGNPVPAFEWFGSKDENWLKMGSTGWAFESLGSFRALDSATYEENLARAKTDRNRWLVLVALAGVSAVAAVILLVVELTRLGWIP